MWSFYNAQIQTSTEIPIRICVNLWVSVSVSVFVSVLVSGRVNAPLDPAGVVDIKDRNHNILVEKTSNILVHN